MLIWTKNINYNELEKIALKIPFVDISIKSEIV